MTTAKIADLVDEGLKLRREIKALKAKLDGIETALADAGLKAQQEPLADEDREGRRFMAHGSRMIVPVIFTADKLVQSFKDASPLHAKLYVASGGKLEQFYRKTTSFESLFDDGKKFRAEAAAILGTEKAPRFISACVAVDKHGIPKSDTKIAWDAAQVINS